jgi:ElaB/YqjD/DUF883 family membrane-anchored ribosome-binding protein
MKNSQKKHVGAEDILKDLQVLATDTKQIFADNVQAPTSDAISALRERLESMQARMSDYYTMAKAKTLAGARATDDVIRTRPYHSLAIALAVGVLIGVSVSGRKND